MPIINLLVEGNLDEAVAIKIIEATGHTAGVCYGKRGSGYIARKVQSFNQTARSIYYLTLIDFMDTHLLCPAEVVARWVPHRQPKMLFRVVVRELESWLLADRNNLAIFLNVGVNRIPNNPEKVSDPKREVINLARRSRSKRIYSALVPEIGSTATVGKLYDSEMRIFINKQWDVQSARNNAQSLDKCLRALESLS